MKKISQFVKMRDRESFLTFGRRKIREERTTKFQNKAFNIYTFVSETNAKQKEKKT